MRLSLLLVYHPSATEGCQGAMQAEGVAFLNHGEKPLAITRNTSHIGTGPHAF
jgi:hypothetical protein